MKQANAIRVTLFRAIDETSMVVVGNEIKKALDQAQQGEFEFRAFTIRRFRSPVRFNLKLGGHPISSDALSGYCTRLLLYPLAARLQKADVYHVMDDHYGGIVRALDPRRCIVTFNHETPDILRDNLGAGEGAHYKIQRYIFEGILRAAFIVTASEYMRQHILSHYPVHPDRLVCNYYGLADVFHPRTEKTRSQTRAKYGLAPDWFIVLHVGHCGPVKNVEAILRALAQLPPDVHFVQVGGQLQPSQQVLVEEHGLGVRVHCLGFLPSQTDVAEMYCAADALAFPSLVEGFGLPIIEAMASGLPVVTSNTGVMAEVAADGARLVDPHNPTELAAAIILLQQSAPWRQECRAAGVRRAQSFSWQKHAATLCELYRTVYASARSA